MTDEVVTRLYRCLTDELRSRGHVDGEPIKVADLYQSLVPYGSVRSALDVELNADYEHALLRLLAGERGLLRLEPDQAREELRREVDAPFPFVGLFRKFANSMVWVNMPDAPAEPAGGGRAEGDPAPAARPVAAAADPPVEHATSPEIRARPPVAGRGTGGRRAAEAVARAPVHLHESPVPAPASGGDPTEIPLHPAATCAFCGDDLPQGRRVRYCPFCGGDQRLRPCARCQAVLERDWRYCISCGHETPVD